MSFTRKLSVVLVVVVYGLVAGVVGYAVGDDGDDCAAVWGDFLELGEEAVRLLVVSDETRDLVRDRPDCFPPEIRRPLLESGSSNGK